MYMDKKLVAAVSAAIQAYMELEAQENGKPKPSLNLWRLSGLQDCANARQLWQQRAGAVAGSPVSQRAYPLLKYHYH